MLSAVPVLNRSASQKWTETQRIHASQTWQIIIIICKDALLSKGASNEEMASQDWQLHSCDTDSENTSLLVNNSNISLLFPPDTFTVITFAGALRQVLAYCVHLNAELFSCAFVAVSSLKSAWCVPAISVPITRAATHVECFKSVTYKDAV